MQNKLKIHVCFPKEERECYEKILHLPFKPENGDIINVDLGEDSPEGKRYCGVQLRDLIYDVSQEYWTSRPDIYRGLTENNKKEHKEKEELLP